MDFHLHLITYKATALLLSYISNIWCGYWLLMRIPAHHSNSDQEVGSLQCYRYTTHPQIAGHYITVMTHPVNQVCDLPKVLKDRPTPNV